MVAERFEIDDLNTALGVLQQGGLILYPTDTIWGIGCDATNEDAVRRVFQLKGRDDSKALISIVDSSAKLLGLMPEVPEVAYDLIEATTTPLTIVYPNVRGVAPNLIAQDGSAAIRVIEEEPFCHHLCRRFRKPIVSTSANLSGKKAPASFADISEEIRSGVDYIVRYRQEEKKRATKPSSIIQLFADGTFKLIR